MPSRRVIIEIALLAIGSGWAGASRLPRCPELVAVSASTVEAVWCRRTYNPVVRPGQYTWSDARVNVHPIGRAGVVIFDYVQAACVANLDDPRALKRLQLPERAPRRVLHVAARPTRIPLSHPVTPIRSGDADALWWQSGNLALQHGLVSNVVRRAKGSVWVPTGECVVGPGAMHSTHFVGCAALVLSDGQMTAFAHCTSARNEPVEGMLHTTSALEALRPTLATSGSRWRAFLAVADGTDSGVLRAALTQQGIPIARELHIGTSGHSVWFTPRTGSITVVPE